MNALHQAVTRAIAPDLPWDARAEVRSTPGLGPVEREMRYAEYAAAAAIRLCRAEATQNIEALARPPFVPLGCISRIEALAAIAAALGERADA